MRGVEIPSEKTELRKNVTIKNILLINVGVFNDVGVTDLSTRKIYIDEILRVNLIKLTRKNSVSQNSRS